MIFLDKLSQRSINPKSLTTVSNSPLPNISQPIRSSYSRSISDRLINLSPRGTIGSSSEWMHEPRRFVADLPANVQLEGIKNILSGQSSGSQIIDDFVLGMSRQGRTPEQIRLAFIDQQKNSPNPLVI